jgi:flagellin-specific chaperone FliS
MPLIWLKCKHKSNLDMVLRYFIMFFSNKKHKEIIVLADNLFQLYVFVSRQIVECMLSHRVRHIKRSV